jgi:uncharacterized OB-fold protein
MYSPENQHAFPSAWRDEMPVTNRYTFGIAGERFFRTLKDEGKILGTRCSKCDHIYVPAALFCERCLGENVEWLDVGTVGEIISFTKLHIGYDGSLLDQPELVAFIRFGDGGLIHRLEAGEHQNVAIGQQVRAVLKPADQRQGSIQDILHFEIFED